jgi:hypothetical protein
MARLRFWQGALTEDLLAHAEQQLRAGKSRRALRELYALRGEWHIEQQQWQAAADSCHEAVRMAREVGQNDEESEVHLALAKFHLRQLSDPRPVAEQRAKARKPFHRGLARLWIAIGEPDAAKPHALATYKGSWGAGKPYAYHFGLSKATDLLTQLGVPIPNLPPFDPATDPKFPWEDEVIGSIEKLRIERKPKKRD